MKRIVILQYFNLKLRYYILIIFLEISLKCAKGITAFINGILKDSLKSNDV